MIVGRPSRSLAAAAALLLSAAPAAAQMDAAADICAAIDLAPKEAAAGLVAPLLSATFGAESEPELAENRSRHLRIMASFQWQQAEALEAQIAEIRYGSRSPAVLDAEAAAADARRAQRADALAALMAGRRRLEALERQAQSDPNAIEPGALDRARAAVGQLEQDLPGVPLNVMDHQVAVAQAAAAARRAELAALEERRRQALETKARLEAEASAVWDSIPRLEAVARQYRAALAQVRNCYAQRMVEVPAPPAPVVTPPVVVASPPIVVATPVLVAPPPRVSIPIVSPIPPRVVQPYRDPDPRRPPPRVSGPGPRHPPVAQRPPHGPSSHGPPHRRPPPGQAAPAHVKPTHVKPPSPRPPTTAYRKQMPSTAAEPAEPR